MIISNFMFTFAMSWIILLCYKYSTEVSDNFNMARSYATFYCLGAYIEIKLKCCGI